MCYNNLLSSLSKVVPVLTYRGCQINNRDNAFIVLGKTFATVQDAKAAVDDSYNNLLSVIARQQPAKR